MDRFFDVIIVFQFAVVIGIPAILLVVLASKWEKHRDDHERHEYERLEKERFYGKDRLTLLRASTDTHSPQERLLRAATGQSTDAPSVLLRPLEE